MVVVFFLYNVQFVQSNVSGENAVKIVYIIVRSTTFLCVIKDEGFTNVKS